ncbi:MAG TPA: F0F1 ATP synthase subunit epsilon [Nitrospiria bacterium]|jgi:F-type H+-transporting ATPase subunit epsilon
MKPFTLHLQSATQYETFKDVASFVGEDPTGSFGILAGHERIMASLCFGLARFRLAGGDWQYLALPGALIYFYSNQLFLNTRHYFLDSSYQRIREVLEKQLRSEEETLHSIKESLHRLEEEMFKRLLQMKRGGESVA